MGEVWEQLIYSCRRRTAVALSFAFLLSCPASHFPQDTPLFTWSRLHTPCCLLSLLSTAKLHFPFLTLPSVPRPRRFCSVSATFEISQCATIRTRLTMPLRAASWAGGSVSKAQDM